MLRLASFAFLALVLVGCSSSGNTTSRTNSDNSRISRATQIEAINDYETFDHTAYPTEPPATEVEIEHIVPTELMEGAASGGLVGQKRGFRIQLLFARNKSAADQAIAEFLAYWDAESVKRPLEPVFDETPAVYTVFLQPYYRVRVGDFSTREEAEAVLTEIGEEFPNAFVMVDIVNKAP